MPLLDTATLLVLLVTIAVTIAVGWHRPFGMLIVLVVGVPFRDFVTRALFVNTDLSIPTVTALGRWWFALILGLIIVLSLRLLLARSELLADFSMIGPDWLFLAVLAVALIHTLISPSLSAAVTSVRGYLQPMALYILGRIFLPSRREARWILGLFVGIGVFMAAFGLRQGLVWDEADFRAAGYIRQNGELVTPPIILGDLSYIRPASIVSGPNELGVLMIILSCTALLAAVLTEGARRLAAGALVVLFGLAMVATFSRSSLLGYGAMLAGILGLERLGIRRRFFDLGTRQRLAASGAIVLVAVLLITAVFVSGVDVLLQHTFRTFSQQYHIVDTVEAVRYLLAHPGGTGMGLVEPKGALSLMERGGAYHVEGSLLQIAMEMGVWGLGIWLLFWVSALRRIAISWAELAHLEAKLIAGTAFAGWMGALVAFIFLPLMQSISLMVWLWLLLGLGVSAERLEHSWRGAAG